MTVEELQKKLSEYPKDMQVFISCDEEQNEILKIDFIGMYDMAKTNNNGSYEALVIVPTSEQVSIYDYEDDEY